MSIFNEVDKWKAACVKYCNKFVVTKQKWGQDIGPSFFCFNRPLYHLNLGRTVLNCKHPKDTCTLELTQQKEAFISQFISYLLASLSVHLHLCCFTSRKNVRNQKWKYCSLRGRTAGAIYMRDGEIQTLLSPACFQLKLQNSSLKLNLCQEGFAVTIILANLAHFQDCLCVDVSAHLKDQAELKLQKLTPGKFIKNESALMENFDQAFVPAIKEKMTFHYTLMCLNQD